MGTPIQEDVRSTDLQAPPNISLEVAYLGTIRGMTRGIGGPLHEMSNGAPFEISDLELMESK